MGLMNDLFTDDTDRSDYTDRADRPDAGSSNLSSGLPVDLFSQADETPVQSGDLFPRDIVPVNLRHQSDLEGFSRAARGLVAQNIAPRHTSWHVRDARVHDLFAQAARATDDGSDGPVNAMAPDLPADAPPIHVPALFPPLCETVILHNDPNRFGLLYRILWRLLHEPGLRHDPLDADIVAAQHMAQAVRRDMHKMKAFVRFRSVQDETFQSHPEDGPLHVAWFEPEHHIVEAVAPFFARRFTQMRWAILTPERSVEWNCVGCATAKPLKPARGRTKSTDAADEGLAALRFGPGARREDAPPPDAGEALWLTYYQHIFNPARLKLKMMQKEMPRKYWHNLPEANLIHPLAAGAHERATQMVQQPATHTLRRLPAVAPQPHQAEKDLAVLAPGERVRSLAQLRAATNRCRECPIGEHATQSVCGEGPRQSAVMFVGEQPGDQEDLRGHPFVGPAGQLFDRALAQLGIARDDVFVANAVKHFKYELRGQRRIHKTPTQREAAACLHWLEDEISIVKPQILVALGSTAARSLLGRAVPVLANRGQLLERDDGRRVLVTLHPSALLRMPPEEKAAAFQAWLDDLAPLRDIVESDAPSLA
ncbi:MAG: UdgX family uracil-DNA binding protein [Polaromonas sp.]|nr:UdgX family uracil-DNA binding protein [Polaromonas sp.]